MNNFDLKLEILKFNLESPVKEEDILNTDFSFTPLKPGMLIKSKERDLVFLVVEVNREPNTPHYACFLESGTKKITKGPTAITSRRWEILVNV